MGEGEGVGFGDVAFDAGDAVGDEVGDEGLSAGGGVEGSAGGGDVGFYDRAGEEFDFFVSVEAEGGVV